MINLLPSPKTKQKAKQKGRGMSSGKGGHTVGRGLKGATARSGYQYPRKGFEGGQNPISRRTPKFRGETRGKTRDYFNTKIQKVVVKLSELAEAVNEEKIEEVNLETLVNLGFVKPKYNKVVEAKILFDKKIDNAIKIKGVNISATAKEAVVKAGGTVEM